MTELKEHQEVIERCISEKIDSYMSNYSATSIGDYAANAFIRAYIDEVSRIKKRGTRRQKIAYLIARMKNKESISKQVNNMIIERIK